MTQNVVYSRLMAKSSLGSNLQRYALLGAQARLQQLADETAAIYRQFPQLRTGRPRRLDGADTASSSPTPRRKRRVVSAANRQAVSERMRKYWAEWRAQKTNGADSAASTGTAKRASKGGRSRKDMKKGAKRGRRKMSAAARKRISAAQKKRWAALRKTA
jgi:hypothetical protein